MGITTAWPNAAAAHATGQSFVALLPTGPYMAVGVATVALSIILIPINIDISILSIPFFLLFFFFLIIVLRRLL